MDHEVSYSGVTTGFVFCVCLSVFYCTLLECAGKVRRTERYMGFLLGVEFGHMENNCAVCAQDC
jgi:hypothetical protein